MVNAGRHPADPIEALFRDRYSEFVALAVTFVRDTATAEEVVQDAFTAVLARTGPLVDAPKVGGSVAQAVANGSRDRLRRRAVEERRRPFDPSLSTQRVASGDARAAEMLDIVLRLPARQAQCVTCRYLLDMTFPEIASALEVSLATAKTHVRRGTAQLAIWTKEHP